MLDGQRQGFVTGSVKKVWRHIHEAINHDSNDTECHPARSVTYDWWSIYLVWLLHLECFSIKTIANKLTHECVISPRPPTYATSVEIKKLVMSLPVAMKPIFCDDILNRFSIVVIVPL